jgi:hypothetical protein
MSLAKSVPCVSVVVFAVLFSGCDLLQTREPEKPSGGSASTFLPPTTHDIVITNLQAAVREKNVENYRRCLVDSNFSDKQFEFSPTSEAQLRHEQVFSGWSVGSEVRYFERLTQSRPSGISQLDFSGAVVTNQSAEEVVFTAKYHLIFQHLESSIGEEARGSIQMHIARDKRSEWSIYRWIDVRDTSETTWSDIKALFSTL